MERSTSITQRVPRSSRLRALARRSTSAAEGAYAAAAGHAEATVQLARRVARNPFVPWKAWRKEKYGYAAVPTAALPPPSDVLTSLRSIKAHRNPVQQIPGTRLKQRSRKGRRNNVRPAPDVELGEISTSRYLSYFKAALSGENTACSPPSTSTLSIVSSDPSSPFSAATAPLSPLSSSRSFSVSTTSARSGSAVANPTDPPCVCCRQQQEQKRMQEQCARGKQHQNTTCELCGVSFHRTPCARAVRRGANSGCRSSPCAFLETRGRRWMLAGQGQRRQHKRVKGSRCEVQQEAEQWWCCPTAALRCRAAFPPPCSCPDFRQASAASLLTHTEKLEARRLAFSASPGPGTRSTASNSLESGATTRETAEKCAGDSTADAGAPAAASSTTVAETVGGEKLTGAHEKNNRGSSPLTATDAAPFAASESARQTPAVHSASESCGAGLSLPVFPSAGTDTRTCSSKAANVSENSHFQRSVHDAWGSSNGTRSSRGFFITLHSFNCKARRCCDMPSANKRNATGVTADGAPWRSAVGAPSEGHPAGVAAAFTRAADTSASPSGRTVGSSQATANAALEATVSSTHAASRSEQINVSPRSNAPAAAAGTGSTQATRYGAEAWSVYAEATAAATASAQNAATAPPFALTSTISGLYCAHTAATATASQTRDQSLKNGCEIAAVAEGTVGGGGDLSNCSGTCARGCATLASRAPVDTHKNCAAAADAPEAHRTDRALRLVQAEGSLSEATSCAAVGAGLRRSVSSSYFQLDALQEFEQHSQSQHSSERRLNCKDVRYTPQRHPGEQLQLQQKQLHSSHPGEQCSVGRQYEFCGSSIRKLHTESEGETDDSENGVNCRQKEARRWSCMKLTKPRIHETLHCTLSQ